MSTYADKNKSELETLITSIDSAITQILNGAQSYQIGSRQLTRANLPTLLDMRSKAVKQLLEMTGGNHGLVTFEPQPDPDPKYNFT